MIGGTQYVHLITALWGTQLTDYKMYPSFGITDVEENVPLWTKENRAIVASQGGRAE